MRVGDRLLTSMIIALYVDGIHRRIFRRDLLSTNRVLKHAGMVVQSSGVILWIRVFGTEHFAAESSPLSITILSMQ
jgi:hypothetical protein